MGNNPEKGSFADVEFSHATHAGPPPTLRFASELSSGHEHIFLFLGLGHRFDALDLNRELELWLAGKSDLTYSVSANLVNVVLLHITFDVHSIGARDLEEQVALFYWRGN